MINVNNRDVTVSVDRLKPAFIVPDDLEDRTNEYRNVLIPVCRTNARDENNENNKSQTTQENTRDRYVTRSGCRVRFPDRLQAGFG
jgi:hypothetical protein